MKQSDLVSEIDALIERECKDRAIGAVWIRQTILDRHSRVEGEDAELALLCMREHIGDTAEAAVRRRRPQQSEREQLTLEGFDYIQRRYTIEREGESVIVPVELLTSAELRDKAKEQRSMGAGCYAHADELDRLADEREAAAP